MRSFNVSDHLRSQLFLFRSIKLVYGFHIQEFHAHLKNKAALEDRERLVMKITISCPFEKASSIN